MTLFLKTIWIIVTILGLVLNSIFPSSDWLVILQLLSIVLTGYILICYSDQFKFNTPWGIPYFILLFLNLSILERLLSDLVSYYNLTNSSALTIKLFVALSFILLALRIGKHRKRRNFKTQN
jgi:hypothetical protein